MRAAKEILDKLTDRDQDIRKFFGTRDEIYQYLSEIGYKWMVKQQCFKKYDYKHPSIQAILLQIRSASDEAFEELSIEKTHGKQESGLRLTYNTKNISKAESFILERIRDIFEPDKAKITYYVSEAPHHENTSVYIKGIIKDNDTIKFAYHVIEALKPEATLLVFNEREIGKRVGYSKPYIDLMFQWSIESH